MQENSDICESSCHQTRTDILQPLEWNCNVGTKRTMTIFIKLFHSLTGMWLLKCKGYYCPYKEPYISVQAKIIFLPFLLCTFYINFMYPQYS